MQDDAVRVIDAVGKKEIALSIFCGSEDADCLPMAEQLYTLAAKNGLVCGLIFKKAAGISSHMVRQH